MDRLPAIQSHPGDWRRDQPDCSVDHQELRESLWLVVHDERGRRYFVPIRPTFCPFCGGEL